MVQRVLVIEGFEALRQYFAEGLARAGYEVVEADDGEQALALLGEAGVDQVVVDIPVPIPESLEGIALLRRRLKSAGIVALGGGGKLATGEAVEAAARRHGADLALLKPVLMDELLAALAAVTKTRVPECVGPCLEPS